MDAEIVRRLNTVLRAAENYLDIAYSYYPDNKTEITNYECSIKEIKRWLSVNK